MSDKPGTSEGGRTGPESAGPESAETGAAGPDLARAALAQARQDARRRGAAATSRPTGKQRRDTARPGTDRDPALLGSTLAALLAERGWESTARAATVTARWAELVGDQIAEHSRPERLVDGELVLVAESTAWATQLRLLVPKLLARLHAEVGPQVVRQIRVHGPTSPSWRHGPRRVVGPGPRDTYG